MSTMKVVYNFLRAKLHRLTNQPGDAMADDNKVPQGAIQQDKALRSGVSISAVPTVTSSGHMFWNARDIIFSDSRKAAADALTREQKKEQK